MKAVFRYGLIGASGLLIGWLVTRGQTPEGHVKDRVPASPTESSARTSRGSSGAVKASEKEHSLAALLKWWQSLQSGDPEMVSELERLDASALRSLMTELMAELTTADIALSQRLQSLLIAAAKELYHREGARALEWAAEIEDAALRRTALSWLISAAAHGEPEFAKTWADRYRNDYGRDWANMIAYDAIRGATARGAEDLIRLKELMGDDLHGAAFPQGGVSDDFDFQLLISTLGDKMHLDVAMQHWAARDREAAWTEMLRLTRAEENRIAHVGDIFQSLGLVDGEEKAAAWIAPKLRELPDDLQSRAMQSLAGRGMMTQDGIKAMMSELNRESERIALAAGFISFSSHSHSGSENALHALQLLGTQARVDALTTAAERYRPGMHNGPAGHAEMVLSGFEQTANLLGLTPEMKEQVISALGVRSAGD